MPLKGYYKDEEDSDNDSIQSRTVLENSRNYKWKKSKFTRHISLLSPTRKVYKSAHFA